MADLAGRTAIITGGSRGLGYEIACQVVHAGANVVVASRTGRLDRQTLSDGNRVMTVRCDISSLSDVDNMFAFAVGEFGRIDILVNNAAVLGPVGPAEGPNFMGWWRTMEINLGGTVYCTQKAVAHMKPHGAGKIINIGGGGADKPLPRRSAYACSKAAVVRFTETVAAELEGSGIEVNAVAPGPMATEMMNAIVAAGDRLGAGELAEHERYQRGGREPIQRAAALVTWLASAESDGLTGRYLAARFDDWPFSRERIAEIMRSDLYTLRRQGQMMTRADAEAA